MLFANLLWLVAAVIRVFGTEGV